MTTKYYINEQGQFLGSFSENSELIPQDAIEVPFAPNIATKIWNAQINQWQYSLEDTKTAKIAELKKNRDLKNISPIDTIQAYEMIDGNTTTNLVKFLFLTAPTGNTATEPNNLLFGVLLNSAVITGYRLPYSCQIIDSEVTLPDGTLQRTFRRGYVAIDGAVAGSLSNHFAGRATTNIQIINEKETLINNATTMEELEAIDLTLPTNENDTRYI